MPRVIAIDLGSHQVKVTTWRLSGRTDLELEERIAVMVPQGGSAPGLEPRLAALDALLDEHPTLAASPSERAFVWAVFAVLALSAIVALGGNRLRRSPQRIRNK